MGEDFIRSRRLRKNDGIRRLVRETALSVDDFVYPIFITNGNNIKKPIPNMPGQYHYSVDQLKESLKEVVQLGILAVIVFGLPDKKDKLGSEADSSQGIVQKGVREIKKHYPFLTVITDVCLCQYTIDGHCGVVEKKEIDNDITLKRLQSIAVSHGKAGADIVAPSDMMDGRVKAIRNALDMAELQNVLIMSYSAKFSSSFYSPFRGAVQSKPSFGDRQTYQMDPANRIEAKRQIEIDIDEGADIMMVKPALHYLDIIRDVKNDFPIAAYHVSGEYAMFKLAAQNGLVDEKKGMIETLIAIKRAGADIIITYFAKEIAKELCKK
ncbi:porphobilinogen synthase [Proteinivorax tanatarense]|uniref:Delta-aminolevulinic acid dehydratase n=1 Tax=Proteinivorax tanatarense TaxID=1260629 RepID=A0AAU7VKF2_9FIRM